MFEIGTQVQVIEPETPYTGRLGTIAEIDDSAEEEGDFFGVRFGARSPIVFFRAEDLMRVEFGQGPSLPWEVLWLVYHEPADTDEPKRFIGTIEAVTGSEAYQKASEYYEIPSHDLVCIRVDEQRKPAQERK